MVAASSAAGSEVCCNPSGPNNRSRNCWASGRAAGLLGDQAQQRVVRVAVLVGRARREFRRVPERDIQDLLRRPGLRRVGIQSGREFGRVRVVVQPAAHLQQLCDGDVLAVGHVRNVGGHRVAELELAVLGEEHDQRRRSWSWCSRRSGNGCVRRAASARPARSYRHGAEGPLRGAELHHRAGNQQLLGRSVHGGLERGRIDGLQRRPRLVRPRSSRRALHRSTSARSSDRKWSSSPRSQRQRPPRAQRRGWYSVCGTGALRPSGSARSPPENSSSSASPPLRQSPIPRR